MGVTLKIEVTGDAPKQLQLLGQRAKNLAPAFDAIGGLMLRSVEKNFQAGGRPTGWLPLSLTTLGLMARRVTKRGAGQTLGQARHARLTSRKILIDTAALKSSITYQVFTGGNGVEIGTNVPYARVHQLGGQAGRGRKVKIPARPYLLVQQEDVPRITQILGNWIAKGEKAAG